MVNNAIIQDLRHVYLTPFLLPKNGEHEVTAAKFRDIVTSINLHRSTYGRPEITESMFIHALKEAGFFEEKKFKRGSNFIFRSLINSASITSAAIKRLREIAEQMRTDLINIDATDDVRLVIEYYCRLEDLINEATDVYASIDDKAFLSKNVKETVSEIRYYRAQYRDNKLIFAAKISELQAQRTSAIEATTDNSKNSIWTRFKRFFQ